MSGAWNFLAIAGQLEVGLTEAVKGCRRARGARQVEVVRVVAP